MNSLIVKINAKASKEPSTVRIMPRKNDSIFWKKNKGKKIYLISLGSV